MFFLFLIFSIQRAEADLNLTEYGETVAYSNYMNTANHLYNELFKKRNYNKLLSPIYERMDDNFTASEIPRFNVDILLSYIKIFGLDAESQIISVCLETILTWKDTRLAWDPAKYDGIEKIWVNIDAIWIPENQIGNSKTLDLVYPDNTRTAVVYSNGTIGMANVYYAEISCQMDVLIFPFDKQVCEIGYMAFSYDWKHISMTGRQYDAVEYELAGNGEWQMIDLTIDPYYYGEGNGKMDVLAFHVHLKRVPNFYVYVIALPCFILNLLGIIGMFWTPNIVEEQLAKLSIGLTSLVSITVLLDMVSQSIPKTDQFPLLGLYVVASVVITSIACVVVVGCTTKPKSRADPNRIFDKPECRKRSMCGEFFEFLTTRHVIFQLFFQMLNLAAFTIFMSFWFP